MAVKTFIFILVAYLAGIIWAKDSSSKEDKYIYECGNKFYQYNLDDEPAEYGLYAGDYAPGKKAYVGLGVFGEVCLQSNRLQLDPPGIMQYIGAGPAFFTNDSNKIWYLYKNPRHKYQWVNSSNAKVEPFAIEFGSNQSGLEEYIGRIVKNGIVMIGVVTPVTGYFYYPDENGISRTTRKGYQVLTCKSKKPEKKIPTPKYIGFTKNVDSPTGCVNNWQSYKNDDAPSRNGVSAGSFDCDIEAYVGKGKALGTYLPGRIQTNSPSGLYLLSNTNEIFMNESAYYLVYNPQYTYRWKVFDGTVPDNVVYVRSDVGSFALPVARVKVNGRMKVGRLTYPIAQVPNDDGIEVGFRNSELLVCDPWPKYQCAQQWRKLNVNISVDGFSVDSTSFIGRGIRKCINGCDYSLGKIQAGSNGVNYLDDLTASEVFDNSSSVEYLVKNANDTYKWKPSVNGDKVDNAIELHKEGHRPFYIGMTYVNDVIVVGKVRPGEGLFYVDPTSGKQQSTNSYDVLTCTSPDPSNGEYEEKSDANWFSSFGCPVRKQWSFTKWRCICRDEFRGVFAASGAKWKEETCSYSDA